MIEIGILKLTSSVPCGSFDDETILMTEGRIFIRDLIVYFFAFQSVRDSEKLLLFYDSLLYQPTYALKLMYEVKKEKKEKWKWLKYTIKFF